MKHIHLLPLTREASYLETCWREVKHLDAKGVHFSHNLCHDATDLLNDPERAAEARGWVDTLVRDGREIWVWTHEIHSVPDACLDRQGRLRFDDTDWAGHLKQKYDRFLGQTLPGITGLVFTFAETPFEVYKDHKVVSTRPPDERLAHLMRVLVDICRAHGVRVAVRDFVYRPHEVESMGGAIRGLPPEVVVMSKGVPHDWQPFYPPNPLLGRVGDREQWVEFDLGYEYEGQHMLPYANLEQHHAWRLAADRQGIHQVCLRIDRYDGDAGQSAVLSPWGRLMLAAFSAWDSRPDTPPDTIRAEWEATQFPGAGQILDLATRSAQSMFFPARNWLLNHCMIPSYEYAKSHLVDGNAARRADWTHEPEDLRVKEALSTLPEGFRDELAAEAAEALKIFQKAQTLLENRLPPDHADADRWRDGFRQLASWLRLVDAYRDAFFRVRELEEHPERAGQVPAAEQAIDTFRARGAEEAPLWMDRVFTRRDGPMSYHRINRAKGQPAPPPDELFQPVVDSLARALHAATSNT